MPSNPAPRVLCVDDDVDAREMLSELLKFSLIEPEPSELSGPGLVVD